MLLHLPDSTGMSLSPLLVSAAARGSRRKGGAWCFAFRAVALHFYALGRPVARIHEVRFRAPKIQLQELVLKEAVSGELCSVAVTEPAVLSQCSCFLELFELLCSQCYKLRLH